MAQRNAVTGAQGFTGRHIANRLLAANREVLNLTGHLDREDHFGGRVPAQRLAFDDPAALRRSLIGVDGRRQATAAPPRSDGHAATKARRASRLGPPADLAPILAVP